MKHESNETEKFLTDSTTNTESKFPLIREHRWIPGHEGRYAACLGGHIWSYLGRSPRRLKPGSSAKNSYLRLNLYKDGCATTHYVHQLVCAAFNGPKPEDADCVAHFDDDRLNNLPDNLRYTVTGKTSDAKDLLMGKVDPAFYTRGSNQFDRVLNQSSRTRRADGAEIREYLRQHPIDCECRLCR